MVSDRDKPVFATPDKGRKVELQLRQKVLLQEPPIQIEVESKRLSESGNNISKV